MPNFIRWFKDLTIEDIPSVGGKNASLGEMYSKLTEKGVPIPNGFALTGEAYRYFISYNKIDKKIKQIVTGLDVKNVRALHAAGTKIRGLILSADFPEDMKKEIIASYKELSEFCKKENVDVAVRSSATAEDLPDASFAGQQESYLNVRGDEDLMEAVKKCISSLFTDRAISYREAKGFDHMAIALSVGVQQMVRSDLGASGVMFTLDTESGFKGVVLINASYGLGEYVVKGRVTPDQFYVFKEGLKAGLPAVISHKLGSKDAKLIYSASGSGTKQAPVSIADRNKFCITNEEVLKLAKWGVQIEEHYGRAMDIEWAKDGATGELYIVQARSETVKSREIINHIETYKLGKRGKVLATGTSVGQRIGQGKVRIINNPKEMHQFQPGEVLVTRITDPDWEPIMRIASAIVTEEGGKTSHAAIVSRELGITCVVGAQKARSLVKNGQNVTVSCAEGENGYIYEGLLPFEVEKVEIKEFEKLRTKVMVNIGDPEKAFSISMIPSDGVGLAREEFIFTNFIRIHPLALINYKKIKDKAVKKQIDDLTIGYKDKTQYVVDKLAEGIAFIAAPFYPNEVVLRFSDFKTNEYATLIGGAEYEPKEENPMIGWRGASRYYDEKFKPAFGLECQAIKKVREEWGLKNVVAEIPFCRTVEEGKKVIETMKEFGLEKGADGLKVIVMCEIPSNVILAKEFSEVFDGFSIGSNDLTQLTLGVDRDSALVSHDYDEQNMAVKKLIQQVIQTAHECGREVGFCGQAPSEYPEFAEFLVQVGIDSISLNPDTLLKTRERIAAMEKKIAAKSHPTKTGKVFKIAKTASLAVVAALSLLLVGFTCKTVNNAEVEQQIQRSVDQQVQVQTEAIRRTMAEEYEQKAQQQAEEQAKNAKQTYTEDSFAKFQLTYPASWQMTHGSDYVSFKSVDGIGLFTVSQIITPPENAEFVTTTEWNGYQVKLYDSASSTAKIMDVLQPEKNDPAVRLEGDNVYFDQFVQSLSGFSIPN